MSAPTRTPLALSVDYAKGTANERTFGLMIAGSVLTILDMNYFPYFVRAQHMGDQSKLDEVRSLYKTEVSVTVYDDRYADFQAWCEARAEFLKIQIQPSDFSGRHLISIYDNGPYVEHKDKDGEVTHQDGDNLGFAVDLGMPDLAEWGIIYAPLYGETNNDYQARQMLDQNRTAEFLGPDGVLVQPDGNGGMESVKGSDIPTYSDEQIEAARSGSYVI